MNRLFVFVTLAGACLALLPHEFDDTVHREPCVLDSLIRDAAHHFFEAPHALTDPWRAECLLPSAWTWEYRRRIEDALRLRSLAYAPRYPITIIRERWKPGSSGRGDVLFCLTGAWWTDPFPYSSANWTDFERSLLSKEERCEADWK